MSNGITKANALVPRFSPLSLNLKKIESKVNTLTTSVLCGLEYEMLF